VRVPGARVMCGVTVMALIAGCAAPDGGKADRVSNAATETKAAVRPVPAQPEPPPSQVLPMPPVEPKPVPVVERVPVPEPPTEPHAGAARILEERGVTGAIIYPREEGRLHLNLARTDLADLSALRDLPIEVLEIDDTPVADLTPVSKMDLKHLDISKTAVKDLSPLKGRQLTLLRAQHTELSDISPLKGMPLEDLDLGASQVSDLSPLAGAPLRALWLWDTRTQDITPLRGMPLRSLSIGGTQVTDLSALVGMPLEELWIYGTGIDDLTALKGLPLWRLQMAGCPASDLTPLRGLKLRVLDFTPENIRAGLDVIREMESLETINEMTAADFWLAQEQAGAQPPPAAAPGDE